MSRLWDKGGAMDPLVLRYTVGSDYLLDERLVAFDVLASRAHVKMLQQQGHIESNVAAQLDEALQTIGAAHARGEWHISFEEEDCHTALENRLNERLGEVSGWVHLGRSRNDQVLVALRLYLRAMTQLLSESAELVATGLGIIKSAQGAAPMPGYTHMQRAMPTTVGDWADGYISELKDDAVGMRQSARRSLKNPLGSAAGYGTPGLDLDRQSTTRALGFESVHEPVTAVQLSRGKAEASVAFECVTLLQDLGRLASDLCLFATSEFGFVELAPAMTTGSSIMPQKRNPDVFELVRGHAAQSSADLLAILNATSRLTSGYHRDLQLIKEPLFRLIDRTGEACEVMSRALEGVKFKPENLASAMDSGLDATEEAYRLVQTEKIPFREAYRRVGQKYKGAPAEDS